MRTLLRYTNHFRRLTQLTMLPMRKELNLNQLEAELLLFLHNNPELNTARDAAVYRGFAKSNVSTAVDALVEKGWLTVALDPDSRRVKRLILCPSREQALQRLAAQQKETLNGIVAGFTPEEISQFCAFLARMDKNMTNILSELEGKCHARAAH